MELENAPAEQPSLREALAANLETVESGGDLSAAPAPVAETEEQKAGRTANRLRDESGRLLPGTKPPEQSAAPQGGTGPSSLTGTPAESARPQRPSSWKKDHWEGFDKIATDNPQLAEYINQREKEFQSGVSTYKAEAEQARGLMEAMAPFVPNLQKFGIEPMQAIRNLLSAHERLSLGTPQEKIALGTQIIRDYGIDPQALFQALQGQAPAQQQPQQAMLTPEQARHLARDEYAQLRTKETVDDAFTRFTTAKDEQGQPKYPHFETVKATMAGILQAGLAQDYDGAYDKAIRMHDDLWKAEQQRQSEVAEQARVAAKQATVTRARSNAVSVKSATPVGTAPAAKANSILRDQLSSALDDAMASRV